MRLVYSTIIDNSGLVQYFTVGSWRYILTPSNGWNNVDANVVCRQLGYASGERISFLNSPRYTDNPNFSTSLRSLYFIQEVTQCCVLLIGWCTIQWSVN